MWSLYKSLIELQRKHGGQRGGYGTDTGGTGGSDTGGTDVTDTGGTGVSDTGGTANSNGSSDPTIGSPFISDPTIGSPPRRFADVISMVEKEIAIIKAKMVQR